MPGLFHRFMFRRVFPVLVAVLGGVVSMAVSYAVVRHLSNGLALVPQAAPEAISQAATLRGHANALIGLMCEYLDRVPLHAQAVPPGAAVWIQHEYTNEIQSLCATLDSIPPAFAPSEVRSALKIAASRMKAMIAHPGDAALRAAALREVRHAAQRAEAHVARLGVEQRLAIPSRLPSLPVE